MAAVLSAKCLPRSNAPFIIKASLSGAGEMRDFSLTFGISAAEPATHGDFAYYDDRHYYDCNDLQVQVAAAGTTIIASTLEGSTGGGLIGQNGWVAFFRQTTPSSGDAPVAVAGPFVVDAA